METLMQNSSSQMSVLKIKGWPVGSPASGAGPASAGSMAQALLTNPTKTYKQNRLSRLLDRLAVQLNNNNYTQPGWLMHSQTPPTEETPLDLSVKAEPAPPAYVCDTCGQTFAIQDRLSKHIASRHRGRTPEAARAYQCDVCNRRFARSDMLTRHARLHSGLKPYSCSSCGQVFSRSDHLATHQRTHTGEKPYRCPVCSYAACRRDMITRHMRTHTRRGQTTKPLPQPAFVTSCK